MAKKKVVKKAAKKSAKKKADPKKDLLSKIEEAITEGACDRIDKLRKEIAAYCKAQGVKLEENWDIMLPLVETQNTDQIAEDYLDYILENM